MTGGESDRWRNVTASPEQLRAAWQNQSKDLLLDATSF